MRDRAVVAGWAVVCATSVAAMFALDEAQTIPFHVVWVATGVAYGLVPCSLRVVGAVAVLVMAATGVPLVLRAEEGGLGWDETSEIPLMATLFLVMVWHVRRRVQATDEVLRRAAAERQAVEAQRRFVRFASHELRTPLTVARGFTELLRGSVDGQAKEDAEVVLDEIGRLERVAGRLLTLAQSDGVPLQRERFDLADVAGHCVRRWAAAVPGRRWASDTPRAVVVGDRERIEVALDSLVENAVRHTDEGGRVSVRVVLEGDRVGLLVDDDGKGIPRPERARVFDGFYSVGPRAGTGLGLAIVSAVTAAHGGEVVCGTSPEGGARVGLTLPAAPAGFPEVPAPRRVHPLTSAAAAQTATGPLRRSDPV